MKKQAEIVIYGAEQICASCVNLPSSKDTYEWLEAALSRKYPNQPFSIKYVDIFNPPEEGPEKDFAERMVQEDLFYPLAAMDGEIIGEGNIRLKHVYQRMEKLGYQAD